MKDIVIPGRRITRELMILIGCIAIALVVNIYAILKYKTEWKEVVTTLHITIALGVVIYVVLGILRLVVSGTARLFRRKTMETPGQSRRLDSLKQSAAE